MVFGCYSDVRLLVECLREEPPGRELREGVEPATGVAQYGHMAHEGSNARSQWLQRFFSWVWQLGHMT